MFSIDIASLRLRLNTDLTVLVLAEFAPCLPSSVRSHHSVLPTWQNVHVESHVRPTLGVRLLAEGVGTAFLVAVVVGSGIMAQRLSPNDVGLQLLENAAATTGALIALILALGPVSGAHFNPVVSLVTRLFGGLTNKELALYSIVQLVGGCIGAMIANIMFELDAVNWSTKDRSLGALWFSEMIATIGLVVVIFCIVRSGRASAVPYAVGNLDRSSILVHVIDEFR